MLSTNLVDTFKLAVELTHVPATGNLVVRGRQFGLGLDRATTTVTFWVDNIVVVHLLTKGMRLKTVPSRLAITRLHQ